MFRLIMALFVLFPIVIGLCFLALFMFPQQVNLIFNCWAIPFFGWIAGAYNMAKL